MIVRSGTPVFICALCVFSLFCGALKAVETMAEGENSWVRSLEIEGDFETITTFLKSSIEEEGLTIANHGNVADMLARTKDAVPGTRLVYEKAEIYQFCSAKLGAELFTLAPDNLGGCPLNIFLYQLKGAGGRVVIGYRMPPVDAAGESGAIFKKIHSLLERIILRAAE